MTPVDVAPRPQSGRAASPGRLCLGFTACWALLGAGACASTFVISTIPAPLPDGRSVPAPLLITEALLALEMVPLCVLVPLLIVGRGYLRHPARAAAPWVKAWTVAASAGIGVEALFIIRLAHLFWVPGARFANLGQPSWHALAFAIGFLIAGAAMSFALIGARRSVVRALTV
jgi:hypothetical protein